MGCCGPGPLILLVDEQAAGAGHDSQRAELQNERGCACRQIRQRCIISLVHAGRQGKSTAWSALLSPSSCPSPPGGTQAGGGVVGRRSKAVGRSGADLEWEDQGRRKAAVRLRSGMLSAAAAAAAAAAAEAEAEAEAMALAAEAAAESAEVAAEEADAEERGGPAGPAGRKHSKSRSRATRAAGAAAAAEGGDQAIGRRRTLRIQIMIHAMICRR